MQQQFRVFYIIRCTQIARLSSRIGTGRLRHKVNIAPRITLSCLTCQKWWKSGTRVLLWCRRLWLFLKLTTSFVRNSAIFIWVYTRKVKLTGVFCLYYKFKCLAFMFFMSIFLQMLESYVTPSMSGWKANQLRVAFWLVVLAVGCSFRDVVNGIVATLAQRGLSVMLNLFKWLLFA